MRFHAGLQTLYELECWRAGALVWADRFHNLVTVAGRNKLLDAMFKTGQAANGWYVGLVNTLSYSAYSAADTMASHAGWLEGTPYAEATRPAYVPAAPADASMDNGASKAVFSINTFMIVRGAFLTDVATKGGATGTLYGVGDFTIARNCVSGDAIHAKITLTD